MEEKINIDEDLLYEQHRDEQKEAMMVVTGLKTVSEPAGYTDDEEVVNAVSSHVLKELIKRDSR